MKVTGDKKSICKLLNNIEQLQDVIKPAANDINTKALQSKVKAEGHKTLFADAFDIFVNAPKND